MGKVTAMEFMRRNASIDQCLIENKALRTENKRLNSRVHGLVNDNKRYRIALAQGFADYCELAERVKGTR